MNAQKIERIKEEIETSDRIFSEVDKKIGNAMTWDEYKENPYIGVASYLDIILPKELSEREKKSRLNEYGERLSYVCEHYLKALIIPNMHYDDITNESEAELNQIFTNKRLGIIRYSHYFVKLLTDDNSQIDSKLRESILLQLGKLLHNVNKSKNTNNIFEVKTDYQQALIYDWINDTSVTHEKLTTEKERIIELTKNIVAENDDAYPQSRYGMFTTYVADLDFLYNLSRILRIKIEQYIPNSFYVTEMARHIFYDSNSQIVKQFEDGSQETFNIDENGQIEPTFYDDTYSITRPRNQLKLIAIYYQENGSYKVIKYDDSLEQYCTFSAVNYKLSEDMQHQAKK